MAKKKAVLNLGHASAAEVALKASTIVSKMTGNTNFTTPSPTLAIVTAQLTTLNNKMREQAIAEKTASEKTAEMNTEKDTLTEVLQKLCSYVDGAANGVEAKILSSGFDVKKDAVAIGLLPAPKKVLALEGANDGEINGTWGTVTGAKSYIVELSTDIQDINGWTYQMTVTKAKCTITELTSGMRIWIRVAAINAAGQGAYSDPATKTVP